MKKFKLIRSKPANASFNMSMDEGIFLQYLKERIPVFRIYSWSTPSFTYGFSQKPEEELNISLCNKDGIGIAKRLTGGGVLFHDNEVTYSIACSKPDIEEEEGVFVSYRKTCAFLINFYKFLGLNPVFALESAGFRLKASPSKLCAASYEKFDITIGDRKIGGNAQKRKRDVIFQHGSIPISIDFSLMQKYLRYFPKSVSLGNTFLAKELKCNLDKDAIEEKLIGSFIKTFNIEFIKEESLNETVLVK